MKDHGQNPDKGIKAGAAPVSFNEVEKLTEAKYTIQKYKRILFYVVICVLLAAFLLGKILPVCFFVHVTSCLVKK